MRAVLVPQLRTLTEQAFLLPVRRVPGADHHAEQLRHDDTRYYSYYREP
jgi:hypothetical protein